MDSYNMIVPYGEGVEALATAVAELPTKKIIAVIPSVVDASSLAWLRKFAKDRGMELEVQSVDTDSADGLFMTLDDIKHRDGVQSLIVNVSVGSPFYGHLMLCAAMATGITAVGVYNRELSFLPISCSISHGK